MKLASCVYVAYQWDWFQDGGILVCAVVNGYIVCSTQPVHGVFCNRIPLEKLANMSRVRVSWRSCGTSLRPVAHVHTCCLSL